MKREARGRGHLSSIDMLPEEAEEDIVWALEQLRENKLRDPSEHDVHLKILAVSGEHNVDSKDNPDTYYDKVFLQRVNIWRVNDDVKDFFLNPVLGAMLCSLAGIDGIRIWHDQTLQKGPWGNPSSWHIDVPNWSFHSSHAISMWIALDLSLIQI